MVRASRGEMDLVGVQANAAWGDTMRDVRPQSGGSEAQKAGLRS